MTDPQATTSAVPRVGVSLDYVDHPEGFAETAAEVQEYERVGVDLVAVAEVYSFDSVSQLGYLAAVTDRIGLATGILPLFSRTPALIAMTAAGLDELSKGRFELGLGSSGPQVIEGFHGVPFDAPLTRIRETVEICRTVWRREPLAYAGKRYTIPVPADRGTGLGKPLKLIGHPVRSSIPITIAALTPRGVAQAAEIANGWLPIFFSPERSQRAWGEALGTGAARRDPSLGVLDVIVNSPLLVTDNADAALSVYRQQLALYVGGMGARGANFYNDLATAYGFGDEAKLIQELYLTGRRAEAADAVPEELVRETALIGTESHVRERVQALRAAGATTISAQPLARSASERIGSLEALRSIVSAAAKVREVG